MSPPSTLRDILITLSHFNFPKAMRPICMRSFSLFKWVWELLESSCKCSKNCSQLHHSSSSCEWENSRSSWARSRTSTTDARAMRQRLGEWLPSKIPFIPCESLLRDCIWRNSMCWKRGTYNDEIKGKGDGHHANDWRTQSISLGYLAMPLWIRLLPFIFVNLIDTSDGYWGYGWYGERWIIRESSLCISQGYR